MDIDSGNHSYLLPHSPFRILQRKKECVQLWRVAGEGNREATPEGMQMVNANLSLLSLSQL